MKNIESDPTKTDKSEENDSLKTDNLSEIKPSQEIKLPEIEIPGPPGKVANFIKNIPHVFWIIGIAIFLVLLSIIMPLSIWTALWAVLKSQYVIVCLVLVFSMVAVSLVWSIGQRIDVWVFMFFNMHGKRSIWFDRIMLGITQLGNFVFALIVALGLFYRGYNLLAYELLIGLLTLGLVVQIMKILIHRTRPYIKLENIRIIGSRASGQSFPSGHTAQAFLMVTLILQYFQIPLFGWVSLYLLALVVGITRIYVGMHYPRDVIGGAIIGVTWGLLGVIVNSYIFG